MDVRRILVSVVVGALTWIAVAFVGLLVSKFLDGDIGAFVTNFSVLVGVLAGCWYYFTGRTLAS